MPEILCSLLCGRGQLGAVVVCEGVVYGLSVASGIACCRTTEDIVGIGALSYES